MRAFAAIIGVTLLASTNVYAVPLDDNGWRAIVRHLGASATDAKDDRAEDALKDCNAAKSYAAHYDYDAHIAGRIEMCFGLAAIFRRDRSAACAAYARAIALLTSAEFKNDAQLDLDQAKRSHRELGC